jgi:hypothetical protein
LGLLGLNDFLQIFRESIALELASQRRALLKPKFSFIFFTIALGLDWRGLQKAGKLHE